MEANEPLTGETSVEAVNALLFEDMCNAWQPCLPCNDKFDHATKQLYIVRSNGRGGMIRPPMATVGIGMKAAMKESHTDTSKIRPLDIPDLPLGTHAFDPESDNLIEGVTKVEISSSHAKSKFQEYQDEQGHHDEVYTDGSQDQH